jgi:hypothetical protein
MHTRAILWVGLIALPRVAQAGGTLGVFELRMGSVLEPSATPGVSGGASLGLSLRPRGSPLLFYPMLNVDGMHVPATEFSDSTWTRTNWDLTASLRFVVPLVRRVRIWAEAGGGGSFQHIRVKRWASTLRQAGRVPVGVVGAGLQWRPHQNASLGLRGDYRWTDASADVARAFDDRVRTDAARFSAFVGLHF